MRLALLACAVWLFAAPAHADRITLTYDGRILGFAPIGEASLDIDIGPDSYRISSALRSGGILALFDNTNLTAIAEGSVQGGAVRAGRYDLDHRYARKHRVTTLQWGAAGVDAAIAPNYPLWGEPPVSPEQRLASRDPLSSLVAMAFDVARTRTCAGAYPTFDGRFHYVMSLESTRTERFEDGGFSGRALHCTLRYQPIAGFEASDAGRRLRTRSGDIWFALTETNFAPPVRISVPLPVGRAGIHLRSMQRVSVTVEAPAP